MPSWSKQFWNPIVLRDGRVIATLDEARTLLLALPERHQSRPFWQYAAELLIDAAERSNHASIDNAAAQLSRALAAEGLL
jgi:hypothetical protein